MNSWKSLTRRIVQSRPAIWLRNIIGFRIIKIRLPFYLSNYSASDAFHWRTHNGYVTYFRFSDIPKIYFNIKESKIRFLFFDRSGNVLKEYYLNRLQEFNELVIDKEFLNNVEDYGTFSVFHVFDNETCSDVKIINRCYVGFSKDNGNPSFVHGNLYGSYLNLQTNKIKSDLLVVSSRPTTYIIQKNFALCDHIELFFSNPTSYLVWIKINNHKLFLKSGECKIYQIEPTDVIKIVSNCVFPRPLIFVQEDGFVDCLHA
jgi:hypothetical protein